MILLAGSECPKTVKADFDLSCPHMPEWRGQTDKTNSNITLVQRPGDWSTDVLRLYQKLENCSRASQ